MNLDLKQMTTFNIDTSNPAVDKSSIPTDKPIYVGCSEELKELNEVDLLNSRSNNFHEEQPPEPYRQLNGKEAKKEFKDFWKLVLSIKAYPEAHKCSNKKILLTHGPLKLSSFLKEVDPNFNLSTFLNNHQITLETAFLDNAELQGANLERANLVDARLVGANLNEANLTDANLTDAKLNGAKLECANLESAILERANLTNAILIIANLNEANLTDAMLTNARLYGARLVDAKLKGAKLVCANLESAILERANLEDANLEDANLLYANLKAASLTGAKLERAYLYEAQLSGANLNEANLNGAFLKGAMLDNQTKFNLGTDLRNINVKYGIYINGNLEKDEDKITQFFIERGAKAENISFAKAA